MGKFVGRQREIEEMNALRNRPGAQMALVYGRPRFQRRCLRRSRDRRRNPH